MHSIQRQNAALSWLLALAVLCAGAYGAPAEEASAAGLTANEQAWLDAQDRVLRIGTDPSYQPYAFVDNGSFSGLAADYMAILADRLDVRFEVSIYESFSDLVAAGRAREVDLLPFVVDAPGRRAFLNFSDPIVEVHDRILTRRDEDPEITLAELAGRRVGVVDGYANVTEILRDYPDIIVVEVASEIAGIRELALGGIDAMIADSGVASWHVQNEAFTNLQLGGDFRAPDQLRIGIRSDWPELVKIMNKGLATISDAEHAELEARWIGIPRSDYGIEPRTAAIAALMVVIAALAVAAWVISLRRLIDRRTRALSEEFEARRRVEDMNDRLAVAIEQSGEFVAMIDGDGRIEHANKALSAALGETTPAGARFADLVDESDREHVRDALSALRSGSVWRGEVGFSPRASEGSRVLALTLASVAARGGAQDAAPGFIATARDITDARDLEARLLQGEKLSALGTLAGGIAHDFNNLLVPVLGGVELLRDQVEGEGVELLDAIENAGERSRQLVQRILTFSRQGEADRLPLDLASELESDLKFLRSLLPASVEIDHDIRPCPKVLADRTQIQQILLNLGTNAADALPDSRGRLTVEFAPVQIEEDKRPDLPDLAVGTWCRLSVSDNGHGIEPEDLPRLFDPYFTRKATGKGTGLGLATVHGIVEAHGGAIQVRSTPGQGTRFDIYLPAIEATPPVMVAMDADAEQVRDHAENARRIMLVDDDAAVLRTVKRMLESMSFEVSAFPDPSVALQALEAAPDGYTAIISDYTMPSMLGTEFLEHAGALAPNTGRLMLTGQIDEVRHDGFELLTKPVRISELRRAIQSLLGRG